MHFISEMEVGSGVWAGLGLKTLKLRKWLMTFKIIIAVREAIRSRTKRLAMVQYSCTASQ